MKRETETELGFLFRFFLISGNIHHHGNLGEPELFSIFFDGIKNNDLSFIDGNIVSIRALPAILWYYNNVSHSGIEI